MEKVAEWVIDNLLPGHRARIAFSPPRNNADETERSSPCGLQLVNFIGIDEYGVPDPDLVPLLSEQHFARAVGDDHSVLVPMLVKRRFSTGRNCEVADDKVSGSFGYTQQDLLCNARRCGGAVIG